MPEISEMRESTFVTKADVGPNGAILTITGCEQVDVAREGCPAEMKWALLLKEIDKPFIVNSTNRQIIAGFTGRTNTDHWTGMRIVIYFDPNVSFGGRITGGLRVRAPRSAQPAARPVPAGVTPPEVLPTPAPTNALPQEAPGEDVPF